MTAPFPNSFIIGTGRCGSTLMSELIRLHPDILSLSEFFIMMASDAFIRKTPDGEAFWKQLSTSAYAVRAAMNTDPPPKEFLYQYRDGGPFNRKSLPPICYTALPHLTEDPDSLYFELEPEVRPRPKAPLADQYGFLFQLLMEKFDKKCWAERSGGSLATFPALYDLFPEAKFVHVIRDGRDVAMSILNHPPTRAFARSWANAKRFGVNILKPPYILGTNRLMTMAEAVIAPAIGIENIHNKTLPLPEIGAFWSELILIGLDNLAALLADQLHTMRYEDLCGSPVETLRAMTAFMDDRLIDEDWLAEAAAIPKPGAQRWRDLPADEIAALNAAVAPGMDALGYALD